MKMCSLTVAHPSAHARTGGRTDLLLVNPAHVISVLGTSSAPRDSDTGSIVTLIGGEELDVVESVRVVAELLDECGGGQR